MLYNGGDFADDFEGRAVRRDHHHPMSRNAPVNEWPCNALPLHSSTTFDVGLGLLGPQKQGDGSSQRASKKCSCLLMHRKKIKNQRRSNNQSASSGS